MSGFDYVEKRIELGEGDAVVLYTDGVTEASNPQGQMFEEERLASCLASGPRPPAALCRDVLRCVTDFSGGIEQADDITLLALQYRG